MKTIIEPFRIKAIEPIRATTAAERERLIGQAGYNLFKIPSEAVAIDLLTDSGTGAMSIDQWSALLRGDESYAGSPSFFHLRDVARRLFGFDEVLPVHQGRAAERIVFSLLCKPGLVVAGNTHFDTTRANIEAAGSKAVDLPVTGGLDPTRAAPFKGDTDVARLAEVLASDRVACVVVTITNNMLGGQPVSLENLRATKKLCQRASVPLLLDAARFAENAYLARNRDVELSGLRIDDVVRRYFDLSDGFLLSAKKDALCNTGGLIGLRDAGLLERAKALLIATEGFPTYGGLAGRDLAAMAQGLVEAVDESYLVYREAAARYLASGLEKVGVPCVKPTGLHGVYVDAAAFLPHIPPNEFPGHALAIDLYRKAGIRACEIGSLMRGDSHSGPELLRLALPRRVYTQSHVDYVIEAFAEVASQRDRICGFRIVDGEGPLRHFAARLQPTGDAPSQAPGVG